MTVNLSGELNLFQMLKEGLQLVNCTCMWHSKLSNCVTNIYEIALNTEWFFKLYFTYKSSQGSSSHYTAMKYFIFNGVIQIMWWSYHVSLGGSCHNTIHLVLLL